MTTTKKFTKNDRILLISHIGLPHRNSRKIHKKLKKRLGLSLAKKFQGVTIISSHGYWVTDNSWVKKTTVTIENNATITILLSVVPVKERSAEKALLKAVRTAVKELRLTEISNIHIEKIETKAYHAVL